MGCPRAVLLDEGLSGLDGHSALLVASLLCALGAKADRLVALSVHQPSSHIFQLFDSLVLLAPFSLYPELGSLAIPATGLLTLFFKGLLELSKSFLDPFGNEGYPGQNIRVDVLVSELNFGASSRWAKAGAALPDEEGETPATTPMSLGLQ